MTDMPHQQLHADPRAEPVAVHQPVSSTLMNTSGKNLHMGIPEGFLAAGDTYMAMMPAIAAKVTNKKQMVDSTRLYNNNQAENFVDTSRIISLNSSAGIRFNKKKSQSGSETIELLGWMVTSDPVKPSEKFLGAIRDSPRPRDSTGVRTWFSLGTQCNLTSCLPSGTFRSPSTSP